PSRPAPPVPPRRSSDRFVSWAATVPPGLKLQGREGKVCFKRALEQDLPHDVLYREKMGFGVPISAWFRGPLRDVVRSRLLEGKRSEEHTSELQSRENLV